jgi:hypothetical protein
VERCLAEVQDQAWSVVVLHDIAHASLGRLPELLHRLQERRAVCRQDFPDDVIVRNGTTVWPVQLPGAGAILRETRRTTLKRDTRAILHVKDRVRRLPRPRGLRRYGRFVFRG